VRQKHSNVQLTCSKCKHKTVINTHGMQPDETVAYMYTTIVSGMRHGSCLLRASTVGAFCRGRRV
jgi:hypothetical protein